jgi:hypothetical protein
MQSRIVKARPDPNPGVPYPEVFLARQGVLGIKRSGPAMKSAKIVANLGG